MTNINHWCAVCGKGYSYCDGCNSNSFKSWRTIVDTIDHYKVFLVVKQYAEKQIDKTEARKQLNTANIAGWENFKPQIVKTLKEILNDKDKNKDDVNKVSHKNTNKNNE